jgi:hypothetical protein
MYAAAEPMAPYAKLNIPDVLYVRTSPVPANPYTEPLTLIIHRGSWLPLTVLLTA